MKTALKLLALSVLVMGCASDAATDSMRKDAHGNYASTADYDALDRAEFTAAMQAGLRDFDVRLATLETEAEALGPDALEEYHGCLDSLMEQRREFAATIEQHQAMLADDWNDERENVAEKYVELRDSLNDAYADVVDEA